MLWRDWFANHLLSNHHHGLDRESPVAVIEQIFQTRSKQIDDQDVVESFLAKIVNVGYAGYSC